MELSCGKVLGTILGNLDGIILGIDVGTGMGYLNGSFGDIHWLLLVDKTLLTAFNFCVGSLFDICWISFIKYW